MEREMVLRALPVQPLARQQDGRAWLVAFPLSEKEETSEQSKGGGALSVVELARPLACLLAALVKAKRLDEIVGTAVVFPDVGTA